jgi:hypothetical protein
MSLSINNTISRNVERSFLDYFSDLFTEDEITDVRLEKSFANAYDGTLPCIVANLSERPMNSLQIGSSVDKKEFIMEIRLFCKDDGFRLFLADYLAEKIKLGLPYYEYEVEDGKISSKELKGRIRITKFTANRKELVNLENLQLADKHRHLIKCECRVALN